MVHWVKSLTAVDHGLFPCTSSGSIARCFRRTFSCWKVKKDKLPFLTTNQLYVGWIFDEWRRHMEWRGMKQFFRKEQRKSSPSPLKIWGGGREKNQKKKKKRPKIPSPDQSHWSGSLDAGLEESCTEASMLPEDWQVCSIRCRAHNVSCWPAESTNDYVSNKMIKKIKKDGEKGVLSKYTRKKSQWNDLSISAGRNSCRRAA